MKLRYYLRGLGIGMLMTALIMGATSEKLPLTDAEIRAKATELGMVDSSSLKLTDIDHSTTTVPTVEPSKEEVVQETESNTEKAEEESSEAEESKEIEESKETTGGSKEIEESKESTEGSKETDEVGKASEEADKENEKAEEKAEAVEKTPEESPEASEEIKETDEKPGESEEVQVVTIVVKAGSGSESVCRQLEEAGLIEDAKAFDRYLTNNGYATRISIGSYEIELGTSQEDIAQIITKRKK